MPENYSLLKKTFHIQLNVYMFIDSFQQKHNFEKGVKFKTFVQKIAFYLHYLVITHASDIVSLPSTRKYFTKTSEPFIL